MADDADCDGWVFAFAIASLSSASSVSESSGALSPDSSVLETPGVNANLERSKELFSAFGSQRGQTQSLEFSTLVRHSGWNIAIG